MRLILILLILPQTIFAQPIISEINFKGDEYIELQSNTFLDLQDKKVYDDQGDSKFNTLSKIKDANSSLYLIIGSKFRDSNDIDSLNCTIYQSDKSQVSNGGLKDTTEDFKIEINSTFNITFQRGDSVSFQDNESLHNINNQFTINNQKPCLHTNQLPIIDNKTPNNQSNTLPDNSTQNQTIECNKEFQIDSEDFFENKIEYKFQTDAKNFIIEYYIEDLEANIVRDKKTTTNKNKKSFTPDKRTEIYNIKAELIEEQCKYKDEKQVTFYSKHTEQTTTINDVESTKSYFKIKNKGELTQLKTNKLKYEVYKGSDTSKRTIIVYHGAKKLLSIPIEKKEKTIKGEFEINLTEGLNKILITGLDLEEEFYILKQEEPEIKFEQNFIIEQEKEYFDITQILIDEEIIYFDTKTNLDEIEGECTIYKSRTKITDSLNISNTTTPINYLEINLSKLESKDNELKLSCKYKKLHLKTYKYENEYFNYTKPESKQQFQSLSNFEYLTNTSKKETTIQSSKQEIVEYESKNLKIKENSIYFSFIGLVLLLGGLLFKINI